MDGNRPLLPRWLEVILVDSEGKVRPDRIREGEGTRTYLYAPDIVRFWGQVPSSPIIPELEWVGMAFFEQIYALISSSLHWEGLVQD